MEFSGVLSSTRQHRGGSSMIHTIFKLSLAANMYWLWRERNGRVFHNLRRDCSSSLQNLVNHRAHSCMP
ncbi:hypothetical protein RHMOL_Rhmol04G0087000 [Rhododendron molle]|uniref:Uncharacterized protein n=1 Tax=Rhododendron molle TaxID=49168 RepID=A0ACC0NZJ5_RHOML|nr:hypothetical protein RHMOL_Rhmol04G0087000 [Rhododendron molle]